jgi:hypothetical protein
LKATLPSMRLPRPILKREGRSLTDTTAWSYGLD